MNTEEIVVTHRSNLGRRNGPLRVVALMVMVFVIAVALSATGERTAVATVYVPVSGAGSTWSANALAQWAKNVNQYGMQVNYASTGSSDGRNQFRNGTVDFGVSEIPYGINDNGVPDPPPSRHYAYMPIVAGGTSFMYNLVAGGHQITNLRLSGKVLAEIFTGVIKNWNDPQIATDNPGITLPDRQVVPVVRSDGSGSTAQFTLWMSKQYPQLWDAYCQKAGLHTPCGLTSEYPVQPGFTAENGSLGVAGFVSQGQSQGTIGYVEYSYALNAGFPVAKILNAAGYYTEPTAGNVAVALQKAQINTDASSAAYLTQQLDNVYTYDDPRTYPMSSYSYMIIPTAVENGFSTQKGKTLGAFAYYFLCEGQQSAPVLGYSPLPINLAQAGLDQVRRIPGVDVQSINIQSCHNPTFSSDGSSTNALAKIAPQPQGCDKVAVVMCPDGTGGNKNKTSVTGAVGAPAAANPTTSAGGAKGTGGTGGTGTGGTGTGGTGTGGTGTRGNGGTGTGPKSTGGTGAALPSAQSQSSAGPGGGGGTGTGSNQGGDAGAQNAALGGGGNDQNVVAVDVASGSSSGAGSRPTLILLASLLLLGVVVAPPLVSSTLRRRRG